MNEEAFLRWNLSGSRILSEVEPHIAQTNIDQVDVEHRRLVSYALDLNRMLSGLQARGLSFRLIQKTQEVFQQLYDYAEFHFSSEEELMARHGIPGLESMGEQHRRILENMRVFQEGFRAGRSFASLELKTMIPEWVIGHINKTDFQAFSLERLEDIIRRAGTWEDLSPFIKKTNISTVDREHQAIAQVLLDLGRLPSAGSSQEAAALASRLQVVAEDHFRREEELLTDRRIGLTTAHSESHKSFLKRIQFLRDSSSLERDVLRGELASWLVNHVNQEDIRAFRQGGRLLPVLRESRNAEEVLVFLVHLGVEAIDRDHQEFIRRAFRIFPALEGEVLDDQALRSGEAGILELRQFAREHFAREEHLMDSMTHPIVERHHQEHKEILEELEAVARDFGEGLIASRAAVKERLIQWWLEHTNQTDVETFRDWRS